MTITPLLHRQETFLQKMMVKLCMMIRLRLHLKRHCLSLLGTVTEEREKPYQSGQRNINATLEISHLSLVGGSNPGECVRRVLRSVASNFVWSSYSLRGKKGKMPLLGTAVGSTIKQAIMKWKPGLEEKEVELLMAEVLKHAPSAHSKSLKAWGQQKQQPPAKMVGWNGRRKNIPKIKFKMI
ncbi:unnamed protein product [Gadus morhua 'NCC']